MAYPTRWHTFYTVSPYLPTAGPDYPVNVRFELDGHYQGDGYRVRVVSEEHDGSEVVRFEGDRYRPSPLADADQQMANDIVGFASAYADSPEEFERDPTDYEQEHAPWWERHGDALSCETDPGE